MWLILQRSAAAIHAQYVYTLLTSEAHISTHMRRHAHAYTRMHTHTCARPHPWRAPSVCFGFVTQQPRYMMDILGKPLLDTTVTATNKLWWPHSEALYACTLAYERTGDACWLEWLVKIDTFIYEVHNLHHVLRITAGRSSLIECADFRALHLTHTHTHTLYSHTSGSSICLHSIVHNSNHVFAHIHPTEINSTFAIATTVASGLDISIGMGDPSTRAKAATTRGAFTCHARSSFPSVLQAAPSRRNRPEQGCGWNSNRSEWVRGVDSVCNMEP